MALQLIPLGAPAVDTYTPLAQLGQTFFKQYDDARKRRFEDDFTKSNADLIGGMTPAAPAPAAQNGTLGDMGKPSRALPSMAAGQGDIGQYAQSIKAIESGGKYGIVGPTHPKYGRALGAYQVMEANLPQWSQQTLGRTVTPDEFLANPQIQDAIFNAKFGEAVTKYGNPQDAASVWFTGQPLAKGANRRDVLGTTGQAYVDKFTRGLGGAPQAAPVQVASISPGMGYAPDTRPQAAPMQGPPMPASFDEAVPGAAQQPGMSFAGMAAPQASAPVQRPPMGLGGGMPQSGGFAPPQATPQAAPQQMAQAGPGADPFGFSRMPPQVAAAVKSMMANPLPAAQARAQSIIERYVKTEQWAPFTDPNTGASLQRNSNTGEVKLIQTAPSRYQVQRLENGDILAVDQTTGKPDLIRAGEQDALLRQYEAAKRDPNNPFKGSVFDFKKQLAEAGSTRVNNNIGKPEEAYKVTVGKAYGDQFIDTQKQGRAAVGVKNTLRLMDNLTRDDNFYSGIGSDAVTKVKQFVAGFGGNPNAATPNEVFRSLGTDVILGKLGGSLGAGVSNADVTFMSNTVPNLYLTKSGNRFLIKTTEKLVDRQAEIARQARQYAAKNGQIDAGFDEQLAQYAEANPLFNQKDVDEAKAAAQEKPYVTKPRLGSVPIPIEAANDLRKNPKTREQFDETFGEGAAAKVLGR